MNQPERNIEDLYWQYKGVCRTHDPDMWNATPGEYETAASKEAKKICKTECPVLSECRAWAFQTQETQTILGGMLPRERRAEISVRNLHGCSSFTAS